MPCLAGFSLRISRCAEFYSKYINSHDVNTGYYCIDNDTQCYKIRLMTPINAKKEVVIGLVQTGVGEEIRKNIAKTARLIESAAKKGAQIICLQELFNIPYIPQKQGVKKRQVRGNRGRVA